jgi:hypothetical protein
MSTLDSYGYAHTRGREGYSKLDVTIREMPKKDAETLMTWLHDSQWTDSAIADAVSDWAKDNGRRDLACSHGVVKRWRELREMSSSQ